VKRSALFLDRDGTLIEDRHFLDRPEGVKLLPNAVKGLKAWIAAGYVPVIVTNQSGIARGLFTMKRLGEIHRRLRSLLKKQGVAVKGIYVCPHLPEGKVRRYAKRCDCRKPKAGLLKRAARELKLDLAASVTIGDSLRDVEAGRAAGTRTILLGRDAKNLLDAIRRVSPRPSATTRPTP